MQIFKIQQHLKDMYPEGYKQSCGSHPAANLADLLVPRQKPSCLNEILERLSFTMSSFSTILAKGKKEKVVVTPSSTLNITSITLDSARKSKGVIQVWAKSADSSEKKGSIIGTLSNDASKLDLSVQFSTNNSPVEFWIVGDAQVRMEGTMVSNVPKKKEAAAKSVSKKTKIEEVISTEEAESKAPKNKKQKVSESDNAKVSKEVPKEAEVTAPRPVNMRKFWKVKPQNDEGVLVKSLKPVYKTKDLKTVDYVIGNGDIPNPGAAVKVVYTGLFPDGTVFDARMKRLAPFVFRKGVNQVVKGLDLGMEGMKIGGSREITIPPELGYGEAGMGNIPGNQTLIFRVTLIGQN